MSYMSDMIGQEMTPSEFAKFYFDWTSFPYQTEALDCMERNILLLWGRQTGKSTITAIRGIWEALWKDGSTVLVLSPQQRQSALLFRKMRRFMTKSMSILPQLKINETIARETQTVLEFENGSEIHSLPISDDGGNIRGFTANMVIIDETAQIRNEEAWSAINPMTLTTKGRRWLISTPRGIGNFFYQAYSEPRLGFKCFKTTSFESPIADKEQIEADRARMPDAQWRQEYMAEFVADSDCYYPQALLNSVFSRDLQELEAPLPNGKYILGVDPAAQGQDSSVYCILEESPLGLKLVRKLIEIPKEDIPTILFRIKALNREWGFRQIVYDKQGLGEGIEGFLKQAMLPVEGFQMTIKNKEELHKFLRAEMQQGIFKISAAQRKCRKQFDDLRYEPSGSGYYKIFSASSVSATTGKKVNWLPGGDDFPTAVALANWATRNKQVPVIIMKTRSKDKEGNL